MRWQLAPGPIRRRRSQLEGVHGSATRPLGRLQYRRQSDVALVGAMPVPNDTTRGYWKFAVPPNGELRRCLVDLFRRQCDAYHILCTIAQANKGGIRIPPLQS